MYLVENVALIDDSSMIGTDLDRYCNCLWMLMCALNAYRYDKGSNLFYLYFLKLCCLWTRQRGLSCTRILLRYRSRNKLMPSAEMVNVNAIMFNSYIYNKRSNYVPSGRLHSDCYFRCPCFLLAKASFCRYILTDSDTNFFSLCR